MVEPIAAARDQFGLGWIRPVREKNGKRNPCLSGQHDRAARTPFRPRSSPTAELTRVGPTVLRGSRGAPPRRSFRRSIWRRRLTQWPASSQESASGWGSGRRGVNHAPALDGPGSLTWPCEPEPQSGRSGGVEQHRGKPRNLEARIAEVERVNARLEDAALTTARALGEISRHNAVYEAMRRAETIREDEELT